MAYIYDLTDTWSAGGTVFNAIKMNVTDSASAVASKLVSLQTNGTEHFSVTKAGAGYFSGNVGIGVTSLANTRVYVRTAAITDTAYYADNGANSGFKVKFASSLTSILNDFGADLALGTNDTERMRIDASGNVGIGTASPSQKLNVVGNTLIPITNSYFCYTNDYGIGTPDSLGLQVFASNGDVLRFGHRTGGTTFTEDMRIASNGNVGIGTSSPAAKLDVRGAVWGNYNSTGTAFFTSDGASTDLTISTATNETRIFNGGGAASLTFGTVGAERMRIDSSGNVGTGTSSPSARLSVNGGSGTSQTRFEVSTTEVQEVATNAAQNAYANRLTDAAQHIWKISSTERARIDSSGNVGVGTSAPNTTLEANKNITFSSIDTFGQFVVKSAAGASGQMLNFGSDATNGLSFIQSLNRGSDATPLILQRYGGNVGIGTASPSSKLDVNGVITGGNGTIKTVISYLSDAGVTGTLSNHPYVFYANNEERMRIDSSGNLLVGTTAIGAIGTANGFRARSDGRSLISSATDGVLEVGYNGGNATGTVVGFYKGGALGGSITTDGSTTAYNTSSDVRLKHDIVDAPEASSLIDAIQVRSFKWNADDSEQRYGFIAQELVTVAPEAVSQPEDPEEMMGVDYSKLVPMLVKEIQSLRARVAQLEGN